MRMKDLILASKYKMKINCILPYLESTGFTDIVKLQNLPRLGHFCGIDVYAFVGEINKIYQEKIFEEIESKEEEE